MRVKFLYLCALIFSTLPWGFSASRSAAGNHDANGRGAVTAASRSWRVNWRITTVRWPAAESHW